MKKKNFKKRGLLLKQIVSGPAPAGRILNYIRLAGGGELKHKNNNRNIKMKNGVGSAWTTEFMFGLGAVCAGAEDGGAVWLRLTPQGAAVYEKIKNAPAFDESEKPEKAKKQLKDNCPDAMAPFEKMFRESAVFETLCSYLEENGFEYKRQSFMNDYFEAAKALYDNSSRGTHIKLSRSTSVTTGGNRVPSLIQLCEFFGYVADERGILRFSESAFGIKRKKVRLTKAEIEEEKRIMKSFEDLSEKFGADGNVTLEMNVRNSGVQRIFRNNLLASYDGGCMLCGIKNEELLNASHIIPSAECNVNQKASYENGLLLCANHDRLFDRYLITFDAESGEIKISEKLSGKDRERLGICAGLRLEEKLLTEKRRKCLKNHNREFERRNI